MEKPLADDVGMLDMSDIEAHKYAVRTVERHPKRNHNLIH
ncbi:hypothetical protein MMA231_03646 (plasmid) [Asticcacaulis sp. MM231]